MKKFLVTFIVALMATMSAMAQFPADVKEVLKKCDEKMDDPKGYVIDMEVKMKVTLLSLKGTMKVYCKGDKNFSIITMGAMGKQVSGEYGFDGEQEWEFNPSSKKSAKDSLIITKTKTAKNNEYSLSTDFDKDFKTAKMKEKGLYYEITFSDPLTSDSPKKMTVKIAKDTYYLREIKTSMGIIGSFTLTVTKVTRGCSDSWFKLDMNRYKNAVVVRR